LLSKTCWCGYSLAENKPSFDKLMIGSTNQHDRKINIDGARAARLHTWYNKDHTTLLCPEHHDHGDQRGVIPSKTGTTLVDDKT